MSNIYELPKEIEETLFKYYACFDEETWELIAEEKEFEEIQKALFDLQNQKDELLNWYLKDRANRLADNAGLQNEIDRLQKRIKVNNAKIERVENIIDYNFGKIYDWKAIAFWNFTINYRKSKQTIIENEEILPKKFIKIEMIEKKSIPKADIKKAIESWEIVPWASIQENKTLTIK